MQLESGVESSVQRGDIGSGEGGGVGWWQEAERRGDDDAAGAG